MSPRYCMFPELQLGRDLWQCNGFGLFWHPQLFLAGVCSSEVSKLTVPEPLHIFYWCRWLKHQEPGGLGSALLSGEDCAVLGIAFSG